MLFFALSEPEGIFLYFVYLAGGYWGTILVMSDYQSIINKILNSLRMNAKFSIVDGRVNLDKTNSKQAGCN